MNGEYCPTLSVYWNTKTGKQKTASRTINAKKHVVTIFENLLLAKNDGHRIMSMITSSENKLLREN